FPTRRSSDLSGAVICALRLASGSGCRLCPRGRCSASQHLDSGSVPAMSSGQRLLLLDTASLYFRAFFGVPDSLRAPDGTPVNAVRGLLDFTARLVTDYRPAALAACWDDDWRPQWRVDLLPTYKAHRVEEEVSGDADVEETPDLLAP